MKDLSDELLAEIVRRLVATLDPLAIYLFGSHARDEGGRDSDVDLLVVVRDSVDNLRELAARGRASLWGLRIPVDLVVRTESDMKKWSTVPCNLLHTVAVEGRSVYEAAR